MALSIGIVGLPNVGKSTLFSALTKISVEASNYPFCTIDPNVGKVPVPDDRLQALSKISKSQKTIPTTIEFVDIAGLVKGASQGEGLGNKFLANIREVDAICHVVRTFSDSNITHVSGNVDPKRDMGTIELELILSDITTVSKRLEAQKKLIRNKKEGDEEYKIFHTLQKLFDHLEKEMPTRTLTLTEDEQKHIKELHLLTAKPVLYVYNIDEKDITKHENSDNNLYISAKIEAELAELSDDEQQEMLTSLGIKEPGLHSLIKAGYTLLNLITFFTSGEKESRAWTVSHGATAPQAAGVIHSDFEKQFIRAEIIDWKDFAELGENGAKQKGLMRLEGKEYIIQDGDVCHFRIGQ